MDFVVFVFIMIFCCVVLSIAHLKSTHPLGKNNFPKNPRWFRSSFGIRGFAPTQPLRRRIVSLDRSLVQHIFAPASFEKKTDVSWKCGHVLGVDWWQRIYLRYKRYIQFNKYRSGWWHIDTSQMIITGILATDNETRSSFVEVSNHKSFRYRKCRYRTL